nr:hypothetical protein BaRGS_003004 [Batillaria attramentaria]
MKTQVDYEKIVLWSPSSDLKTTKTSLGDLALNFIKFKFGIKVDLGDNPTAYNVYKQFLTLTDGIITHTKVDYL